MSSSVPVDDGTRRGAAGDVGATGLYDPAFEHDACGVAFVVDVAGRRDHRIVAGGLSALCRMEHRGAQGADPDTGDGAGIMLQIPDAFYRETVSFSLPAAGHYATGLIFSSEAETAAVRRIVDKYAIAEGAVVLGWRDVPVDPECLGVASRAAAPHVSQVFLAADTMAISGLDLDRLVFAIRKQSERELRERALDAAVISLSARTVVYKGMLTPGQVSRFYPELTDARVTSAMVLVHSRFSTNTFPSWPLAHPYRMVAHNGEINTIRGNRNWMIARQAQLATRTLPGRLRRLYPICTPGASDSMNFDEVVELLHLGGRSLPHAMLMMIPEAWESNATMDPKRREFYRFHATMMEPWDGPACVAFTDGTQIGAVLDRNGLRPARWCRTDDGLVVLASESGVIDLDPGTIVEKGRLTPGRMFLVDTQAGRIVADDEIKDTLAAEHPYSDWTYAGLMHLDSLPERDHIVYTHDSVRRRQRTFGYTDEELRLLLGPMASGASEPVVSMGTDTPVAGLSKRPRLLYDYFTQLFAQVTNPPLDAIREELVTSLGVMIGREHNLLEPSAASCRQIELTSPVLDNDELAKILSIDADGDMPGFQAVRVSGLYKVRHGADGMKARLVEICRHVSEAIEDGVRILVLSDRDSTPDLAPIPSLLLTAAVHQHLIREQTRTQIALVVETGDCRTVHHAAVLLGYGAAAINPYLAFESIEDMVTTGALDLDPAIAVRNYVTGMCRGILKIMSKMGISTVSSYCGAQVFEAVGLDARFVRRYFTGTDSRIGGADLATIAEEVATRHAHAYQATSADPALEPGGEYQWRRGGEVHLFNPETVFLLQHATRSGQYEVFKKYTTTVDAATDDSGALRGLLRLREATPIPIDEVEPVENIVTRFSTGAMSYGALSSEAHETLAVAMNRLGGKSNSGEGGEDLDRLDDPLRRSAVKQVASGRFGVTSRYLVSADDIQIKMAQGAKPGEGGQLPGNKVYPWIAATRNATPGVGLISPPPHHDIYSIEDLAQLIHDLKHANDAARINVKLVSEVGVGTVAAGVAKAHADVILISGHDGGTGAAPANSVKHAGAPWEMGLAETQQTLLGNGLRDRVTVQVDGAMKTGRDVIIAALLGAEEYGFATAPLIVSGCVMMRVCHLDTCPVGVATQNPILRERFSGQPEFVENFFRYIAQEVREYLAALGMRSLDEAIGQVGLLSQREDTAGKSGKIDLSKVLWQPQLPPGTSRRRSRGQDHGIAGTLGQHLVTLAAPALEQGTPTAFDVAINNTDRSVGTALGAAVTRAYRDGLPDGTIEVTLRGTAGQSFGAFVPAGVTLRLFGDANDYVGKGLSGGRLIVRPDERATFAAEDNIIAGNTILYGATTGELYCRGQVGERFAVRNSGACAVVEGVGDHGCEYMTGGTVAVLGTTGRNFAAGMSGGQAYVYRLDPGKVNAAMVDLDPMSATDIAVVHKLLSDHLHHTGSPVAARMLSQWPRAAGGFTKVIPAEYKRALADAERREAEEQEALNA